MSRGPTRLLPRRVVPRRLAGCLDMASDPRLARGLPPAGASVRPLAKEFRV